MYVTLHNIKPRNRENWKQDCALAYNIFQLELKKKITNAEELDIPEISQVLSVVFSWVFCAFSYEYFP